MLPGVSASTAAAPTKAMQKNHITAVNECGANDGKPTYIQLLIECSIKILASLYVSKKISSLMIAMLKTNSKGRECHTKSSVKLNGTFPYPAPKIQRKSPLCGTIYARCPGQETIHWFRPGKDLQGYPKGTVF